MISSTALGKYRLALFSTALVFFSVFGSPVVRACDTPVYRYAMYRWNPAPFEIYFFHQGTVSDADAQVHRAIDDVANDRESPTNIVLLPVDLNDDAELIGVPPDVKAAWLARDDRPLPSYLVVSPLGLLVYDGPLDEQSVFEMTYSPVRESIAKQLEEGAASVLVLLRGANDEANREAEKQLRALAAEVANGTISLYSSPADQFGSGEEAEEEASDSHRLKVGVVVVSQGDPREAWLVRTLKAVESDLHEYDEEPMVFAVYGRGRALPPYIGKGITRDNLIECVQFVTGACSCTVKEQNPGADLLFSYNWEYAAEILSEKYGSEEGNETRFGAAELFPDLIIPTVETSGDDEAPPATDDDDLADASFDDSSNTQPTDDEDLPDNAQNPDDDGEVALGGGASAELTSATDSTAHLSIWVVALGLAVAVVVLFFTTLLIIRPR